MSSSLPSAATSLHDPFDDAHRYVSSTSIAFPSGPTQVPRMRSTLLPISLTNTDDKETVDSLSVPKPWRDKPNPRAKMTYAIVYGMIFVGIAISALQCYLTYRNVMLDRQPLCLVMDEQFDRSTDEVFGPSGYFMREVDASGAGNGQFEMNTASSKNSFVKDGMLHLVPTLTSEEIGRDAVFDNYVYNLTDCTFNITQPNNGFIIQGDGTTAGSRRFDYAGYYKACSAVSNSSTGPIINPIQSARISTLLSAREGRGGSIKYGRVEVRAKMPKGDWLWPAIWMLPKDSVYGEWPRSGEIDMVESRGNGLRYTARGSNFVQGTLNWGPSPALNGAEKSFSWWTERRESFADGFHTYVLEWTDKFLRIYVDSRTRTLLSFKFKEPFFDLGDFPTTVSENGQQVPLQDPWVNGTGNSAPFDQDFYLIMNVAAGSTTGWFPESQGNKPWMDRAAAPMRDFANAQSLWYPTWPQDLNERAMVVDYVKMWKHC
ncbi:concanavalin A-like lectin/glucanase domain-containing protein [Mucidula mucida]|nr:concanavalin A-like lectin/glucanase domain-containing protein [Mucidula mucida]